MDFTPAAAQAMHASVG
jgi:hypothetical protein